jgi:hypothetical protein
MVPVAPIITGITLVFIFHMRCIYIVRSSYFKIFSASFLTTFLSPEIATSINIQVQFSLLLLLLLLLSLLYVQSISRFFEIYSRNSLPHIVILRPHNWEKVMYVSVITKLSAVTWSRHNAISISVSETSLKKVNKGTLATAQFGNYWISDN